MSKKKSSPKKPSTSLKRDQMIAADFMAKAKAAGERARQETEEYRLREQQKAQAAARRRG